MRKLLWLLVLILVLTTSLAHAKKPRRYWHVDVHRRGESTAPHYHKKRVVQINKGFNPNKYDNETRGWVESFPVRRHIERR